MTTMYDVRTKQDTIRWGPWPQQFHWLCVSVYFGTGDPYRPIDIETQKIILDDYGIYHILLHVLTPMYTGDFYTGERDRWHH
jgi:hypothetical protein